MFLERNGIFNSADFGITFAALLGGEMDEQYQKTVNEKEKGKYGSLAVGLYNGGGYHAIERNTNKTIEGRLTLRPLPAIIPGFQVSYTGVYGKGNTVEEPDWIVNMGLLSLEYQTFVLTGSYYTGVGNFSGTAVDSLGQALDQRGFSVFGEYKLHLLKLNVFGRYDYFIQEKYGKELERERYIVGIAHYFYKSSKVILDFDRTTGRGNIGKKTSRLEVAIEVHF
jgi:hypothetical protein